jgi:riboflavin synthase
MYSSVRLCEEGQIMFTGIIQEVGSIAAIERFGGGVRLSVRGPRVIRELAVNDSVAVDGVCQTVVGLDGEVFRVEAVEETLRKTTLGDLSAGKAVNLELPLRLNDRLGGHLVLGHVDGVGQMTSVVKQSSSWLVTVQFPPEFRRYVIPVGSIAVDGISLTVAKLEGNLLTVSVIPHTLENTTLGESRPGERVNLEFDLVGKYIEQMVTSGAGGGISAEKLAQWGYGA